MLKKIFNYITLGYLILICTILPLYMSNGYFMLGEAKGITFMILGGIYSLAFLVIYLKELPSLFEPGNPESYAVLVFLFSNLMTFLFSIDKKTALLGLEGWRMGLLSVVFMIISFYGFREGTKANKLIMLGALVTPLIEFILGILNRFEIYPMDIFGRNNSFLATIGNINWFVGYLAIFVTAGIGIGYTRKIFSGSFFLMGGYTLLGLMALFLQGSDSALLVVLGSYLLLLFISLEIRDGFRRFLLQLMILGLAMEIVCVLMLFFGNYYNYEDSIIMMVTRGHKGLIVMAAGLFLYRLSRLFEEVQGKWRGKLIVEILLIGVIICSVAAAVFFLRLEDYSIGNGRGVIWSISFKLFDEMSPWQKLVGVGHDCFYDHAYSDPEIAESLMDIFEGNQLTNAHCEMLTILLERGLLGLFSYILMLGTLLNSFWQNKRKSAAVICALPIFAYLVNGLVSFQTPVSTPYIFILLGIGAHYCREKN